MKKLILVHLLFLSSKLLFAQFQGTNPVSLSATGMNAELRAGLATDYAWIQSYGARPLRINDIGNNLLLNAGGGFVGIGTLAPNYKLSVVGSMGSLFSLSATGSNAELRAGIGSDYAWLQSYGAKPLRINEIGNDVIININGGNVAIGTTDPKGYRLAVAGKAIAEEVTVKLKTTWPDYVFEKGYVLPPLDLLESYVQQNKHLPEVPTVEEVKQNGISLGEMNTLLLKKVEELTLYLIEVKKETEALKTKVEMLESKPGK